MVQRAGEFSFTAFAQQVGAPDVQVEQGIAGKQRDRLVALLGVEQLQGDMFRRMPGCVHDLQRGLPELYRLATADLAKLELVVIRATADDLCPGALRQRLGAGHEVGMDMCFDGVGDSQASRLGHLQVDIDVAAGSITAATAALLSPTR